MTNAFQDAANDLFADENLSVGGQWRAGGTGPSYPVRVLKSAPDASLLFGSASAVVSTVILKVRVSEITEPNKGDTITIFDVIYRLSAPPRRDSMRAVWTCEAVEQP